MFFDADHDYLAVGRDFEHWAPFVCAGGFDVLDDFSS
ncbi:MAG: hypothetical protein KGS10_17270 [Chloroflexi bacterium]|nr:hypothetical protein [Chloroflexota bacterium]